MARSSDRTFNAGENVQFQGFNNEELPAAEKAAMADSLSTDEVEAKVIYAVGTDPTKVKIKFFRKGLAFGIYKSADFDQADAAAFRDELLEQYPS